VNLHDVVGQLFGAARDNRNLVAAGRDDHLLGEVNAVGCVQHKAVLGIGAHLAHVDTFPQRRIKRRDKGIHIGDDLFAQHEAVWIGPVVGKARELALPIRRDETEGVPALRAPCMSGALPFEHHVIDAALFQIPAD
jgi:hypothetical protein